MQQMNFRSADVIMVPSNVLAASPVHIRYNNDEQNIDTENF